MPSEPATDRTDRIEAECLIRLKCRNCKEKFITDLLVCHEADSTEYRAKSYCVRCEVEDPLRELCYRTLVKRHVENQRIDPDCFEADRSVDTDTDRT